MGFSTDATGKPTYDDNVDLPADIQGAVNYAESIGGLLKLTSGERTSLTSGQTKPGWIISETNTGYLYLVTTSQPQGRMIAGDTGDQPLTLFGGWAAEPSTPTPTYRVRNGVVSLNGRIRAREGATVDAFQLPAGARPSAQRVTSVMRPTNTFETALINTNGVVSFYNLIIPADDYRLASIPSWPAA